MLKGIDPRMPADLLDVLMRMGHGDETAGWWTATIPPTARPPAR